MINRDERDLRMAKAKKEGLRLFPHRTVCPGLLPNLQLFADYGLKGLQPPHRHSDGAGR
jgi:hypothetical protein